MTKIELLACAARCDVLAEACLDPRVAEKLRQLGCDYRELAGKAPPIPPEVLQPRGCALTRARRTG